MKQKIITLLLCMLAYHTSPTLAQSALEGQWQLVASPIGVPGEGGIMTSGMDTIPFTATLTADGQVLQCHADRFFSRGDNDYPMDWLIAIEHNDNKIRLGWICDDQQPTSSVEFQELANAYALFGPGVVEGEHRYLYLLSYNIDTGREEGMTLWSGWMNSEEATFTFPQNQQLDAIVSTTIPFTTITGFADSWASARIKKVLPAGISTVNNQQEVKRRNSFDLQGRHLNGQLHRGLVICNGRKHITGGK